MSKDVRRLFAAQKAAKAGSPSVATSVKKVTHPLAKYDPNTMRLSCAICGPAVAIRSDNLWNAHLVSKAHQEAVAKLRAVREQMQKRELAEAEKAKLQQQQQQAAGVKRKATGGLGGLVAYDDSESESEDEAEAKAETKRQKVVDEDHVQANSDLMEESEYEDGDDITAGLPAGFFDSTHRVETQEIAEIQSEEAPSIEGDMEGVLPAGFFDDPKEDARVRTEVGGATADQQQRQLDAEFKALQAELANAVEIHEQLPQHGGVPSSAQTLQTDVDKMAHDEQDEPEDQELQESVLARTEEEYQLFVEMQERLEALRMKKERIAVVKAGSARTTSITPSPNTSTIPRAKTKTSNKQKSILDVVREQEQARKEKERQAAMAFAKLKGQKDSNMASGNEQEEDGDDSEDEEDIEAMMDWRARRV
ncbi:hypothetical protein BG004_003913 [Podila humilis]|nr:hypothetical protein BG004_003913 [Podila humilis]